MKKKTFALCGIAALSALSLASCNKKPDGPSKTSKGLDIYINYNGSSGITYRGSSAYTNPVENNTNYTQGTLLPTWVAYSEYMAKEVEVDSYNLRDASGYTTSKDDDTYNLVKNNNYTSDSDKSQNVDLFYNTVGNINKMGAAGEAVDLLEHLDVMPNFAEFLKNNPTIKSNMIKSGKIFYTPYFDGYNDIERMFIMDTSITKKVLTKGANFDTSTTNGGSNASANVVQSGTYKPYMGEKNYGAASISGGKITVDVSVNGEKKQIQLTETKNIIAQQNELLAKGCTGKQLAEQFITYLETAYAGNVGTDKTYKELHEIFTSESAAYTTDDLIALMRVVKANPGLITGDANSEVVTFFPRGEANNRVDNIADLLQLWGVQGLDGKKEMLYFTPDGKINDAASNVETYNALSNISAMYDEGLILKEFYTKPASTSGTRYLDKYFKKTSKDAAYGFMMYDYSAANCASNDMVDGIGTDPAKRQNGFEANFTQTGITPVLPPLAYWQNGGTEGKYTKSLMRYAESSRSLKSNSWCIPSTSDNIEDACKLMDYMFSEEGAKIQDFGPSQYWVTADKTKWNTIGGEKAPEFNSTMKQMIASSGKDFWSFMRENIGSTHGIGCIRSAALDVTATNSYGQVGLNNVKSAIADGVLCLAKVDKYTTNKFDTTVPTAGYGSVTTENSKKYAGVTAFWSSDKCAEKPSGWTLVVTSSYSTYFDENGNFKFENNTNLGKDANSADYSAKTIQEQLSARKTVYLYTMANGLGKDYVPTSAKPQN